MSLKNNVLAILETNRGKAISGQLIADNLGVSRNAVWKAVNALKEEGYRVISITNKGYQLAPDCDLLSAEGVRAHLDIPYRDISVFAYKEIDSTNSEAKRLLADGLTEPALVIAESQSKGKGRCGRTFYSPGLTGAYMSLIIHLEAGLTEALPITTMAAVAVTETIESLTGRPVKIKWINDIYFAGKKICGILTEAIAGFETGTVESVIVGIGINVSTSDFPRELTGIAGSLPFCDINRNHLIAEITNRLLPLADNPENKAYLESYRSHSLVLGKKIDYYNNGNVFSAKAIWIDNEGGLVIEKPDGNREVLRSGEITVRLSS